MATAAANEILTEWETALRSYRGHKKSGAGALMPTAIQLFKLGLFFDAIASVSLGERLHSLQRSYHEFLSALSPEYCESLWGDLNQAFWNVLQIEGSAAETDKIAALQSVSQLLEASPLAAQMGTRHWSTENLSSLIDCYNTDLLKDQAGKSILSMFRIYLLQSQVDFEQLLPALHLLQQDPHVWDALVKHLQLHHRNQWREIIVKQFTDESQQQYLNSLLAAGGGHTEEEELAQQLKAATATATRISSNKSGGNNNKNQLHKKESNPAAIKEQEIQRRIDQVKAVLPHIGGDGFIETALAAHQGLVDATVACLLEPEPQWPAILRVTDRQLPRRKHEFSTAVSAKEEAEAKQIAKATVQAAERQQEEEAYLVDMVMRTGDDNDSDYLDNDDDDDDDDDDDGFEVKARHNEYNDDYDDQYDDLNAVGNADSGLYDNYDAVRVYNAALKQVGVEQSFWEENRNTNQSQKVAAAGQAKKDFGPDRMKGGRIPGRGRGGGRGGGGRGNGGSTAATGNATTNKSDSRNGNNAADGNTSTSSSDGKPNLRAKARKLDKRRDQQKKAQVKRSGV